MKSQKISKIACALKSLLQKLLYPPVPVAAVIIAVGFGSVTAVLALGITQPAIRYGSYFLSAYALAIAIALTVKIAKRKPITKRLRGTPLGRKILDDPHYRSRIMLASGLAINLAYIAIKLISGIMYRSVWFISLAIYYVLLAIIRLMLLRTAESASEKLRRCRFCGMMLLLMNVALGLIVAQTVFSNRHFSYPGYLIYAMAAYSFYAVITAAVGIFGTRKTQNPILTATKAVNFVAALVSVLSLTTAMLAQFGGDDDSDFGRIMTASVGSGTCVLTVATAIYVIVKSNRGKRSLKE